MKKSTILFSILVFGLFFLSNVNYNTSKTFIMTLVSEKPILPETPFDYSNIPIPDHLVETDEDIGYGSGGIDPNSFDAITDDGATLGRVLFYDKKLSAVEDISCGSCHLQELSFTENIAFSEGVNSLTKRNSMHLNDLAWTNDEMFAWSMKESDLHQMIILPLTDENEIGANIEDVRVKLENTTYYSDLFTNAYGDSEITEERIVDALVQFIESMTTFNSKFDQGVKEDFVNFTETEKLGQQLFSKDCASCHVQGKHGIFGGDIIFPGNEILFAFPFFFNNGLVKIGDDNGAGEWNEEFDDLFKLPTLRNIELTGPYMHDGRFLTLEDVVDHYSDEIVPNDWSIFFLPDEGFGYDDNEKSAMVAFLKTLTDESFLTNPKWSDPFRNSLSSNQLEIESVALYPNPMTEKALIKFANPGNDIVSINVMSQDGKLVKHDRIKTNQYELNKEDYHQGIYFVQIIMGNKKSTQKLIIN